MVAGVKRRVLTSDDLLRQQERYSTKKPKLAARKFLRVPREKRDGLTSDSEVDDGIDETEEGDEETEDEELLPLTEGSALPDVEDRLGLSRLKRRPTVIGGGGPHRQTLISFGSLGISLPLQSALSAMSIRTPTEVQAACIPPLLSGEILCSVVWQLHS